MLTSASRSRTEPGFGAHARRRAVRAERADIVRGALAGIAGAVALAVSDALERALLGREPVYVPARVAARLSARVPGAPRRGLALRFPYAALLGAGYGATRGLLPGSSARAGARLGVAVWALELLLLPATGATPPVRAWPRGEPGLLFLHTLVFGLVTAAAFEA